MNSHSAGLRRLNARAQAAVASTETCSISSNGHSSYRCGCFSFAPLAHRVVAKLRQCQVAVDQGLSHTEMAILEARLGFLFPPDWRAVLQQGLPVSPGFIDWRSWTLPQVRLRLDLPISGLICEVARGRLWLRQWGLWPAEPGPAVAIARSFLSKVPPLLPLFARYYIPCSPNLAGNPVFFVNRGQVFLVAPDLETFFDGMQSFNGSEKPVCRTWAASKSATFRSEKRTNMSVSGIERPLHHESFLMEGPHGRFDHYNNHQNKSHHIKTSTSSGYYDISISGARYISFWSGFVEQRSCIASPIKQEFCEEGDGNTSCLQVEESIPPMFLSMLEHTLRKGGWEEDAISEMIYPSSSPHDLHSHSFNLECIVEELILHLYMLSNQLQEAGWSSNDSQRHLISMFVFFMGKIIAEEPIRCLVWLPPN